jgi:hypothetical protein
MSGPMPSIPYELIGKAVVAVVIIAAVVAAALAVIFALGFIWIRGWTWISNRAWHGYDPHGEYPPLWKLRVAGVTIALARFEFRKVPAAYREAEELADNDLEAHLALRQYLKSVFIDD